MLSSLLALLMVQITPVCELSPDEQQRAKAAQARSVSEGDLRAMVHRTPLGPPGGCGVWLVTVEPDGSVSGTRLLRHNSTGAYEGGVSRYLLTKRYRPSDQQWEALVAVMFYPPTRN